MGTLIGYHRGLGYHILFPFFPSFFLRKKDNTPKNTYLLTQSLEETLGAYTYLVKKYLIVPLDSVWTKH